MCDHQGTIFPNASVPSMSLGEMVKLEGAVLVGTLLGNCFCYGYSMGTNVLDLIDSNLAQYSFLTSACWERYGRKGFFSYVCFVCCMWNALRHNLWISAFVDSR
jgi:hypothetical protein